MEMTYAYLAGVIDIGGVITIARRKDLRLGQLGYYARIALTDPSPVAPKLLHSLFPGRLSQSRPTKASYSPFWLWEADHSQAREPLLRLLPHLRLKQRQAELALTLMGLVEQQNVGRPRSKLLGAEQQAARQRLYEEVARLNSAYDSRKRRVQA
jgi:hypothetical protein